MLTLLGIVLPSLLIAVGARKLETVGWRTISGLIALVVAFLALPIFTAQMPVPLDEVARGYPYKGVTGVERSINPLTNDTVRQMLPWMQVAREELFAGRLPLWNPYSFSGYPLLGNAQSAPFSPFFLVTLFVPLPKQLVAMAGLKLFVSLLFGFIFLKREGLSFAASMFGSIAFAFCIFQNVYLYFPMGAVTAMMPVAAAAISLSRENRRGPALMAISVATMLASGHPESVFHVALATGALLAIDSVGQSGREWMRQAGRASAGAIAGLVLSAPTWVPVLELVLGSARLEAVRDHAVRTPVFPVNALWPLLNPNGFGNPARGDWNWIGSYVMIAPIYLGLIPLALAVAALVLPKVDRRAFAYGVAAVAFLLLALNWTPVARALSSTPPFSWVVHDRLRFAVVFFSAAAAARLLDRLGVIRVRIAAFIAGAIVFGAATYLFVARFGRPFRPQDAIGAIALLVFLIFLSTPALRRRAVMVCAAVTLAELVVFNFEFNALTPQRLFRPEMPIVDAARRAAPPTPYRIVGYDWTFLPNGPGQYGLEDIRGSDPMAWGRYAAFFRTFEINDPTEDVKRVAAMEHSALDFLNVRYLFAPPGTNFQFAGWRKVYTGADGELFENQEFAPRFFAPAVVEGEGGVPLENRREIDLKRLAMVSGLPRGVRSNEGLKSLWIGQMSPQRYRLTVEAARPVVIASSVPAMPGWRVLVDGRAAGIQLVNGSFIGVLAPAGRSKIVVEYRPASFFASLWISLIGLGVAGFWFVRNRGIRPGG